MFLFDNVINLRYIEGDGPDIGRALDIVKMRNSNHSKTLNKVTIGEHGIEVGNAIVGSSGRLGWSVLRSASSPASALKPSSPLGLLSSQEEVRAYGQPGTRTGRGP